MTMKNPDCLLVILTLVSCATAQDTDKAIPQWKATLHVVDEKGDPVPGASVKIWYHVAPPPGQSIAMTNKSGWTDSSGAFFAAEHSQTAELAFEAQKKGYYSAGKSYELGASYQDDPVKWSPSVTLLLKSIRKPIPMFAKRIRSQPPISETPAGYDLEAGDWVAPNGKGTKTDVIFTTHFDKRAKNDWDYKLSVSFPKPGDGIQQFEISDLEKSSSLRSPHEAPQDGYQPQWTKTQSQRPGEPSEYGIDKRLNFFIRVRTVLDEQGKVKSAFYGKIYGDFMDFQYYFNPTPGDGNVEFDPKQNLLKGLRSTEQVDAP